MYLFVYENVFRADILCVNSKKHRHTVACSWVLIKKYQQIGKISIYKDGVKLTSINILSNEEIQNKTYIDYLKDIIDNFKICV